MCETGIDIGDAIETSFRAASCTVMRRFPIQPRSLTPLRVALAAMVLLGVLACDRSPGGVTISGDVAGLDTIGLRGAALIAEAGRMPTKIDSLRAIAEGKVPPSRGPDFRETSVDPTTPRLPGDNPMTTRARARGDSMARAAAMRLASGSKGGRTRGDTVRGVVALVGVEPAKRVVLKAVNGGRTIALSGMATTGLSRLVGVELMVRGVMITSRDVVVSDYVVRAVDGVPAWDGKLASGANGAFLVLTDGSGRKAIAVVPSPLRGLAGERVWIAMNPGTRTARAYGVIGRR